MVLPMGARFQKAHYWRRALELVSRTRRPLKDLSLPYMNDAGELSKRWHDSVGIAYVRFAVPKTGQLCLTNTRCL